MRDLSQNEILISLVQGEDGNLWAEDKIGWESTESLHGTCIWLMLMLSLSTMFIFFRNSI